MIARHCFSKEWIAEQRKKFPKADPYLIERQLAAFELLGLLAQSGKDFVFKGGTALVLLLPVARRLSIDIDIVGDYSSEEFVGLVKGSLFSRMEEHERDKKGIPKRHFKFYYTSVVDGREAYVLLDVLYADHGFPKVLSVPIVNALFETEKEVSVITPTINGITGDKLTAFAPHTTGVPYGADKSMEIIKQLFDIGELFDHCSSLSEVHAAYNSIWKQEASFRNKKFTLLQTLDDTIEAAFLISQARLKGSVNNDDLNEMQKGIRQLTNYF
ncbi:MAG: nucleotidyl transferase AbiEii/AbiGii toxin family protein, partial [Bacteroidota bacterium]